MMIIGQPEKNKKYEKKRKEKKGDLITVNLLLLLMIARFFVCVIADWLGWFGWLEVFVRISISGG